jgi:hypothetical protein
MDLNGQKRKVLAKLIGEALQTEVVYKGPPSYAYDIGVVSVDRNGVLHIGSELDNEALYALLDHLLRQDFPAQELPDQLVIQMPLADFTDTALDNLHKLVASKATLIQKALGVDCLPIEQGDNTLDFPWFPFETPPEDVVAYTQFISALCDMAKKQQRVLATEKPIDNEKYAFRCFLLRLGFIGEAYANTRKILLRSLSGNGSMKSGERKTPPPEPAEAPISEEQDSKSKFSLRGLFQSFKAIW